MATKPALRPEWATAIVTDDAGQPNVMEPPAHKKTDGWDYREFPVRNWMNWLFRTIHQWIVYFEEENDAYHAQQARAATLVSESTIIDLTNNVAPGRMFVVYAVCTTQTDHYVTGIGYMNDSSNPQVTEIETGGGMYLMPSDGGVQVGFYGRDPETDKIVIAVQHFGIPS